MTDDNSNLVDMDDLETFENAFYERPAPEAKDEVDGQDDVVEEDHENGDDAPATEKPEAPTEEDENSDEGEAEDEQDDVPEKPKPKKTFQDRINEVTARAREAERREEALLKRLEELELRSERKPDEKPAVTEKLPEGAPKPDDTDDKGEPKYPLGEYDPLYITHLTRFTIATEAQAAKAAAEAEAKAAEQERIREELGNQWTEKVAEVEKEIPDIREHFVELQDTFQNIDPAYGEFLASTVMSCENGPLVMYYLSQNIGEAQKIVASGPAAAILALGRLDARLGKPATEEKRNKKQSDAPPPPENRSRGAHGRFETPPDTDDLEAFERAFYKK